MSWHYQWITADQGKSAVSDHRNAVKRTVRPKSIIRTSTNIQCRQNGAGKVNFGNAAYFVKQYRTNNVTDHDATPTTWLEHEHTYAYFIALFRINIFVYGKWTLMIVVLWTLKGVILYSCAFTANEGIHI